MSEALELRLRRNQGRLRSPAFRESVSTWLEIDASEVRFASLEETDQVFARDKAYSRAHQAAVKHCGAATVFCSETHSPGEASSQIAKLVQFLPDEPALLYLSQSAWCGAVRVRIHDVIKHAWAMLDRYGSDDIAIASNEASTGFLIAKHEDPGEEPLYQVVAWRNITFSDA